MIPLILPVMPPIMLVLLGPSGVNDVNADPCVYAMLCASSCPVDCFSVIDNLRRIVGADALCQISWYQRFLLVILSNDLPAIAILPFIARAYIADHQHRLVLCIASGLMGVSALCYKVLAWCSHQSPKPTTVIDGLLAIITASLSKTRCGQANRNCRLAK